MGMVMLLSLDEVFVYGTLNSGCDGYEGVDFLTIISKTFISRLCFSVFMFGGFLWLLVVSICKFNELKCIIGVWLLLGAPNMHSMLGMSFAWDRHDGCRIQYRIVELLVCYRGFLC
jgi:hypothetical protein